MRSRCSGGMPGPWSRMITCTPGVGSVMAGSRGSRVALAASISTTPPSGMAWRALISRLLITWAIWARSTSTGRRSAATANRTVTLVPLSARSAVSRSSAARSTVSFWGAPPRAKVSSWTVRPWARSLARRMAAALWAGCPSGGTSCSMSEA